MEVSYQASSQATGKGFLVRHRVAFLFCAVLALVGLELIARVPLRPHGPANFHDVRACVSPAAAQVTKSHVAFFCFSDSEALIGKPQFQIDVTRLPDGPRGQRAKPAGLSRDPF